MTETKTAAIAEGVSVSEIAAVWEDTLVAERGAAAVTGTVGAKRYPHVRASPCE